MISLELSNKSFFLAQCLFLGTEYNMAMMRKTRVKRKAPGKARRRPAARRGKVSTRQTDRAVVVEGAENPLVLTPGGTFAYNYTTSLSEFQRAQEVAHAYKYYRCAKIELQFVPYANYAAVGGGAISRLPQLYFTVDRVANQWILPTEEEMIERGISPKLFKGKLTYTWKPSLLQNVQLETEGQADGGGNPLGIQSISAINSVPLFNKWLPTQQAFAFTNVPPAMTGLQVSQPASNPYALRYYGAVFVIDQEGGSAQQVGDLISKVTWEFKGPRALKTNAPTQQVIISPTTSMINPGVVANTQPTNYPA